MTLRFGTDGVRGVADRDLTPELVAALGRSAARVLGAERPFLLARDTRQSGPKLEAALVEGLCGEGADVALTGVLPTPGLAYLAQEREAPAAMISASHNPFSDNGVKLFAVGGRKLDDDAEAAIERELHRVLESSPAGPARGASVGTVAPLPDALDEYVAHLARACEGPALRGVRVVVDCAHGAAYEAAPRAFDVVGAAVDVRNAEPDGTNINDGCGSTHPDGLRRAVLQTGAQAGFAFDGDADRVIAVDERGEVVDGDRMLAVLALDFRKRGRLRGGAVAATVMSNLGLRRALAARDIGLVETPVGDRHVLAAIQEHGLSLGGEQSGHIVCADLATTGDGTLTGLLLLDVMHRTGRSLSELASVVEPLPQVLRNVAVSERDRLDAASTFWADVRAAQTELGESGRVLVRSSGTEPVVRVMVEAPTTAAATAVAERLAAAAERACAD